MEEFQRQKFTLNEKQKRRTELTDKITKQTDAIAMKQRENLGKVGVDKEFGDAEISVMQAELADLQEQFTGLMDLD